MMRVTLTTALFFFALLAYSEAAAAGETENCEKINLSKANGYTECTAGESAKSICYIHCNEGYKISGTKSIYCYKGNWYDLDRVDEVGLVSRARYEYRTTCKKLNTGFQSAMSRFLKPVEAQCSAQDCHKNYRGMSKSQCTKAQCCWDAETFACKEKSCGYRGIPKSSCEKKDCTYDEKTLNCFKKSIEKPDVSVSMRASFNPAMMGDMMGEMMGEMLPPLTCPLLVNEDPNLLQFCTNNRTPGSTCLMFCLKKLTLSYGDKAIECGLDGKWNTTKDIEKFECTSLSRSLNSKQCSAQPCDFNYRGISKSVCEKNSCCWDETALSCKAKKCPGTYKGTPKNVCNWSGCAYNSKTTECYQATMCRVFPPSRDGLQATCSARNKLTSTCKFACPPDTVLRGIASTNCLINGTWKGLSEENHPRCERLCNVEADLTTGEVKYGESSLMRLSEDLDSGFVDEKGCKMKGVLEVDFAQMKSFKLELNYPEGSTGGHFYVQNEKTLLCTGQGSNLNVGSYWSNTKYPMFRVNSRVELTFNRDASTLRYSVIELSTGKLSSGVINMPLLGDSSHLSIGLNRLFVFNKMFSFTYGSGLCSLCASYEV